ncbi:MAG: DUF2892 domain-containing protein [Acidobacteria bacterium]|nr:DUF2892 domain-containing protein [Acidobacteriota bacterium]
MAVRLHRDTVRSTQMAFINFLKSPMGRVLRVAGGFALIVYGGTHASLVGLALMMAGMVPAVTGLAGICLLEELVRGREAAQVPQGSPREGRA